MPERLIGHHRTQVGAADSNIQDISYAFAGVTLPLPAADPITEIGHLVEHRVNLGHYVLPVDVDDGSLWSTQGHVQNGAIFGGIDALATEHGFDARLQPSLLC